MVTGSKRSRTFRRVFVRTPGSRTVKHYRKRQPSKPQCAACGCVLLGVARARPFKIRNMPKTEKRPQRPFGGVLCSACSRKEIIKRARSQ